MKANLLKALKTKHNGVQAEILERVANFLAKTVTKDEDIDTAVEGAAGLVSEFSDFFQREGDRRVTEAQKKWDAENKKADPPKPDPPKPDDMPEWAKAVIDSNKALKDEIQVLKGQTTTKEHLSKAAKALKEKKIPEKFSAGYLTGKEFNTQDDVDNLVKGIETAWTEFQQDLTNEGLIVQPAPEFGQQVDKDGVSKSVKDYVESKNNKAGAQMGREV